MSIEVSKIDEIHDCLLKAGAICNLLREQRGASNGEMTAAWAAEGLIDEAKEKFDVLMSQLRAAAS